MIFKIKYNFVILERIGQPYFDLNRNDAYIHISYLLEIIINKYEIMHLICINYNNIINKPFSAKEKCSNTLLNYMCLDIHAKFRGYRPLWAEIWRGQIDTTPLVKNTCSQSKSQVKIGLIVMSWYLMNGFDSATKFFRICSVHKMFYRNNIVFLCNNVSLMHTIYTVRPNKKETLKSSYFSTAYESFIKYNFHCYEG